MSNIETKKKRIQDTITLIDQHIDNLHEKGLQIGEELTKKENEYKKRYQELKSKGKNTKTNSLLKSQGQLITAYKQRLRTLDNLMQVKHNQILKLMNKNEKIFFSTIPGHLKQGIQLPNVNETNNSIENSYLSGQTNTGNGNTGNNNTNNAGSNNTLVTNETTQSQTVCNRLGRCFRTLKNTITKKKSEGGRRRKTRKQH